MNKPIKPDIQIPESFAENGIKADFNNEKIQNGFDNLQPDVLAGDNLNKFIDDTYKGLNYAMKASDAINLIKEGETLTLKDGKLTSGSTRASGFNLFDTKKSDHILEGDELKGWALQGTYVYKEAVAGVRFGYPTFYETCIEEETSATVEAVTLGDNTIEMHVANNGHIYYDIKDKAIVDDWFNLYGMAWFYGVDTENERIFLPRNDWFEQMTTNTNEVGNIVEAGLPNITGGVDVTTSTDSPKASPSGAFYYNGQKFKAAHDGQQNKNYISFDASLSNPIYGNSDTVQPKAVKKLLYICVGNTTADTSWVNVVEQVTEGVKDIQIAEEEAIARLNATSNALNETQISNCLLEVPQNIKLDLSDGTLTLKAGSKVIVPNGVGVFNEVEITSNLTKTPMAWDNSYFLLINDEGNLTHQQIGTLFSGDVQPTVSETYAIWYDTANNIVKFTSDGGSTWLGGFSLPFALVKSFANEGYEIQQVFNGFGYIGSHVWVDKGVKVLIPNGKNIDGTLKNVEYTFNKVVVNNFASSSWNILTVGSGWITGRFALRYDEKENLNYFNNLDTPYYECVVGHATRDSNGITSFQPKQPVRLVDYNEMEEVHCVVETYQNGSSWYRIWSDGWCEQGGELASVPADTTTTISLLKPYSNANYSVLITATGGSRNNGQYINCNSVASRSTSDFVMLTNDYTFGRIWEAKGYI